LFDVILNYIYLFVVYVTVCLSELICQLHGLPILTSVVGCHLCFLFYFRQHCCVFLIMKICCLRLIQICFIILQVQTDV